MWELGDFNAFSTLWLHVPLSHASEEIGEVTQTYIIKTFQINQP